MTTWNSGIGCGLSLESSMSLFSRQGQKLCWLSFALIINWRVVNMYRIFTKPGMNDLTFSWISELFWGQLGDSSQRLCDWLCHYLTEITRTDMVTFTSLSYPGLKICVVHLLIHFDNESIRSNFPGSKGTGNSKICKMEESDHTWSQRSYPWLRPLHPSSSYP